MTTRVVAPTAPLPDRLREIAELVALGYVRARRREAARVARERLARKPLNGLAFAPLQPPNGTGDAVASTEG